MAVGARAVTCARDLGTESALHLFAVKAFDPRGQIGHRRYARAIVNDVRLLPRAEKRRG